MKNIPRPEGPYYTPRQVAEELGVPLDSIYIWLEKGRMAALKIWHRKRVFYWIPEEEIQRLKKERVPRDRLFNTKEVAAILGINQDRVLDLIRKGQIKAIRVGFRYKVPESEIRKIKEGGKDGKGILHH
ncbi:hypothetical protein JCM16138_11260 [Thermococcus atlanticus]